KCVVYAGIQQVTCRRSGHRLRWRYLQFAVRNGAKRSVKCIQYPVERDTELIGQGPAGSVIRSYGRASRVLEIIGVVLWFKHIQYMGTECLAGFHDERSFGIGFTVHNKIGRGLMDLYAGFNQGIDKMYRPRKVDLIGRDDKTPGIPSRRVFEYCCVVTGRKVAAARLLGGWGLRLCGCIVGFYLMDGLRLQGPMVGIAVRNSVAPHFIAIV